MGFSGAQLAILSANLHRCRMKRFPGRGGKKLCAEALGVSPQQWYPWERGVSAPNSANLHALALLFGVSIEWLLINHDEPSLPSGSAPQREPLPSPPLDSSFDASAYSWRDAPPGSPASFFWLARHLVQMLQVDGLRIDERSLNYLANLIRNSVHGARDK